MKEELRVIPLKNYVILGVIITVSLCILYYFYMWFSAYNDSKGELVILEEYMNVINYNELKDYIVENPNSIIYVSVTGNEKINSFEEKFKTSLIKGEFNRDLLYLNISYEINDNAIKKDMMNSYSVRYNTIVDVPNILVFEDGILKSIYSIKDNGYDIKKVKKFVNEIKFEDGVIDD